MKLKKSSDTIEHVEEWYDYVSEMKDLLKEFEKYIPPDVQEKLLKATKLIDTTKKGISATNKLLQGDLAGVLETHLTDTLEKTSASASSQSPILRNEIFGFAISKSIAAGGLTAAVAVTVMVITVVSLGNAGEGAIEVTDINCDCSNIDAGILNRGLIPQCQQHEKQLQELFTADTFNINSDENGIITGGNMCDTWAGGPNAWPVPGAPENPPQRDPDQKECTYFVGLVGACGD